MEEVTLTMGVKEHIIFPEIDIDKVSRIMGMDITFVTTASSDEEGKALLMNSVSHLQKNRDMAKESMKARERKREECQLNMLKNVLS